MLNVKFLWSSESSYRPLISLPLPVNINRFTRARRYHKVGLYLSTASILCLVFLFAFGDTQRLYSYIEFKKDSLLYYDHSGNHIYRPDGLLELNPNGLHPVFELIKRAESDWNERMVKSSRNFADAVKEYRRRYGRLPPKGFDAWCVFFNVIFMFIQKLINQLLKLKGGIML